MQVIVTSCNGVVDNNQIWLSSKSIATKMGNSVVGHLQDSVTKKLVLPSWTTNIRLPTRFGNEESGSAKLDNE